ncbi:MAG: CHASE2 domain-containing protein [Lewinellaceae bacterium]|nr:CHASE2 domain-containing protein [Lewinellaceae bacterium]
MMWILSFVHIEHHFLDPFTYGIRDYDVTDIVYSRLRNSQVKLDDRIVLVNTGIPDRKTLGQMLERIEAAQPRVIGIDILLEGRKDHEIDASLQQIFKQHDNIVLANKLVNYSESAGAFEKVTGSDTLFSDYTRTGFSNFPGDSTRAVRFFSPMEKTQSGASYCFAVEVAKMYDPASVEMLEKRHNKVERIHLTTNINSYIRFEPETILDTTVNLSEIFRDKIVIIGYLSDYSADDAILDRFYTPLNPRYTGRSVPDMYGAVIHANIVRMMLDNDYINYFPKWATFLFAIVLIYANTFFFFWNYKYFWYFKPFPKILYRWAHLVQVVEIALLFLLTAWVFYAFQVKMDFTVAIVAIILVFDLCIIYYYLRQNIPALGRVPEHFRTKHHHPKVTNPTEVK